MIYFKLTKNKQLLYNQTDDLYENENLSNKFSFHLPDTIDNYNISSFKILVYLKRSDGSGDIIKISQDNNIFKLENKHLFGSKYLKVWLVCEIPSTGESFSTNVLTFDVIPSEVINEPPSNPQITYFEEIKKEFQTKEIPNKLSDLYNDLNYITKEEVINIIKTLAYYSPEIGEGSE